jgi:hypothetical protein
MSDRTRGKAYGAQGDAEVLAEALEALVAATGDEQEEEFALALAAALDVLWDYRGRHPEGSWCPCGYGPVEHRVIEGNCPPEGHQ